MFLISKGSSGRWHLLGLLLPETGLGFTRGPWGLETFQLFSGQSFPCEMPLKSLVQPAEDVTCQLSSAGKLEGGHCSGGLQVHRASQVGRFSKNHLDQPFLGSGAQLRLFSAVTWGWFPISLTFPRLTFSSSASLLCLRSLQP